MAFSLVAIIGVVAVISVIIGITVAVVKNHNK